MCCAAEVIMFIFGMIALIKGNFSLTRGKVVSGAPARIIGVILLLPILIGQGSAFVLGAIRGAEKGMKGQEFTPQDLKDLEKPLLVINAATSIAALVVVVIIGLVSAQPAKPKRRRDEDEFDDDFPEGDRFEDDRPRRRRPPDDRFRE